MPAPRPLFCADCLTAMQRLDPNERCTHCFHLLEESGPTCPECKSACTRLRIGAVFNYDSPASVLIKQLKYGAREELAPLMASWMIVQLRDLDFPWPDALVSVPQSLPRRLVRGYNPSSQLASAMGRLMGIPLIRPLRRAWTATPQSGKNATDRTRLPQEFTLRSHDSIAEKNLLIIDDVITTGSTLSRCCEALEPSFPASIHGLSFCLA